jgi:CCR4-NOT transcription complex subunit 3
MDDLATRLPASVYKSRELAGGIAPLPPPPVLPSPDDSAGGCTSPLCFDSEMVEECDDDLEPVESTPYIEDDDDELNDETFGDAVDVTANPLPTLEDLSAQTAKMMMSSVSNVAAVLVDHNSANSAVSSSVPSQLLLLQSSQTAVTRPLDNKDLTAAAALLPPTPVFQQTQQPQLGVALRPPSAWGSSSTLSSHGIHQPPTAASQLLVPTTDKDPLSRSNALKFIEASLRFLPRPHDCERPKPYIPPNPYRTPSYYPQTPHPIFNTPEIFAKFDTDTLFFIFYYQQATFQQYLAARELKKQSWRYHKKYLTWFQRHDQPKITTDEYEQGTYIYFDYETGWIQRIKQEFVFKYLYLEDELSV